jgi:hypothetical protein
VVRATEFTDAPFIRIAAKGAEAPQLLFSAGVSLGSGLVSSVSLQLGAELKLRREGAFLGPINLGYLVLGVRDGSSNGVVTFHQVEFELRVGAGHRLQRGSFAAAFGLELGAVGVWQTAFVSTEPRFGLEPTAMVATEVRWAFASPFSIYLAAQGGVAAVKKLASTNAVPRFGAGLGIAAAF